MSFEDILNKNFDNVHTEVDFVKRTYRALKEFGFTNENSIACLCICRDEISQSLRSIVKHMWGEAFNLSSLAGMFIAGKTGLKAAMHHAPLVDGKERYVFFALPHIAIDSKGCIGVCKREGREAESTACGALHAFQREMAGGKIDPSLDNDDIEQSLLRMRLIKEIPYGHVPDLLELTRIAHKAILSDLENTLSKVIDTNKNDYAIVTGIQIHCPDGTRVWPASSYCIINGSRRDLTLDRS
jgi:hypothetical protein